MSVSWITPKTNWTMNDVFSYTDYNRIRNNLLYINDKINEMYPDKQETLDLGEAKTGYTNEYRPSEFNAFEKALVSFKRAGINRNLGEPKTYQSNGDFANYNDFIRLEKSCLSWYEATNVTLQSISISPKTISVINPDTYVFDVSLTPSGVADKNFAVTLEGDSSQFEVTKEGMKVKVVIKNGNLANASIKVSLQGCEDTATIRVGSGSFFTYPNSKNGKTYYYSFIYLGSDLDATGVSTLLAHYAFGGNFEEGDSKKGLSGKYGINGEWGEEYKDEDCPYRTDIQNFVDTYFSANLKNALVPVSKWVQLGYTNRYMYESKFFLPSWDEIYRSGSSSEHHTDLKTTTYDWLYDCSWDERTSKWNDGLLKLDNSRNNAMYVLLRDIIDAPLAGGSRAYGVDVMISYPNQRVYNGILLGGLELALPLRPLFFLDKNTKVKASEVEDLDYEIDWTGQSSIKLSDLSAGQIVGDVGDGQYQYKEFGLQRVRETRFFYNNTVCTCYMSIGTENFNVYILPYSSSAWVHPDDIDWSVTSSDTTVATVEKVDNRSITITPIAVGTTNIAISSNGVKTPYTLKINVKTSP